MTTLSPTDLPGIETAFREAAQEAARIALEFFRPGGRTAARVDYKEGGSPVTEADLAVDDFLKTRLTTLIPEAAWLSEETADSAERLSHRHVLVVDPIDGTRGFAAGDGRWCVSIALVTDGRPVVGVVNAPVLAQLFSSIQGKGATCNDLPIRVSPRENLDGALLAGPGDVIKRLRHPQQVRITPKIPSLACRFVHVAAGFLDACLAAPDAHDWDIAAADLIVHEAGGLVTDRFGALPLYNHPEPSHHSLVAAPPALHGALLGLLTRGSD